jgi:hypothetical protein
MISVYASSFGACAGDVDIRSGLHRTVSKYDDMIVESNHMGCALAGLDDYEWLTRLRKRYRDSYMMYVVYYFDDTTP